MLYPVRVDVRSKDKQVRINDSMLIDPTCLPVPPCPQLTNNMNINDVLNDTIDTNSKHLASNLLADMEVQPYSKPTKKSVISLSAYPGLKQMVEDQISCQLRIILEKEQFVSRKRKRVTMIDDKNNDDDADVQEIKSSGDEQTLTKKGDHDKDISSNGLIKVKIRLRENEISVVDELMVDPDDSELSNPLFLAESMAKDLNLPFSMINSLAITIAEQVHGLQVNDNVEGMMKLEYEGKSIQSVEIPSKKEIDKSIPCAWSISKREQEISENYYHARSTDIKPAAPASQSNKSK